MRCFKPLGSILRPSLFGLAIVVLALVPTPAVHADPFSTVTIETVKTSIYVGNVTLLTTPLVRSGGTYSADYRARVFPYFFSNEKGRLWIDFSDADLARLAKGEIIFFKGHAENSDHEPRRIEGRAAPLDAQHGKIKVRVFVTPQLELIFNAPYHFGDAEPRP